MEHSPLAGQRRPKSNPLAQALAAEAQRRERERHARPVLEAFGIAGYDDYKSRDNAGQEEIRIIATLMNLGQSVHQLLSV